MGKTEKPGEKPTMTPASPEAPTAPVSPPPSTPQEGGRQTFSSLAEARNGRPRTLSGVTKKMVGESLPDTRELPIIGACPDCGSGLTRQEVA